MPELPDGHPFRQAHDLIAAMVAGIEGDEFAGMPQVHSLEIERLAAAAGDPAFAVGAIAYLAHIASGAVYATARESHVDGPTVLDRLDRLYRQWIDQPPGDDR